MLALLLIHAVQFITATTPNEGSAIKCIANTCTPACVSTAVYRFENNTRRHYPSPAVADSWDPAWRNYTTVNCSSIPLGNAMAMRVIPEGSTIKCLPNSCGNSTCGGLYRIQGNKRRSYRTGLSADAWDKNWRGAEAVSCLTIPLGNNMPLVPEGESIRCLANTCRDVVCGNSIYRYEGSTRRWYPNPIVASSWNPFWDQNVTTINCSTVPAAANMVRRVPVEGSAIACDPRMCGNSTCRGIYRYENNTRRWYPSPTIAASWDSNWSNVTYVGCASIPVGANMALKDSGSSSSTTATTTSTSTGCVTTASNFNGLNSATTTSTESGYPVVRGTTTSSSQAEPTGSNQSGTQPSHDHSDPTDYRVVPGVPTSSIEAEPTGSNPSGSQPAQDHSDPIDQPGESEISNAFRLNSVLVAVVVLCVMHLL